MGKRQVRLKKSNRQEERLAVLLQFFESLDRQIGEFSIGIDIVSYISDFVSRLLLFLALVVRQDIVLPPFASQGFRYRPRNRVELLLIAAEDLSESECAVTVLLEKLWKRHMIRTCLAKPIAVVPNLSVIRQ